MSSHRKRRTTIGGQFAPRLIEMLESPAYRVLSKSAHRILARLEIELAHHGGKDNGRLPVTFEDFQNYGIDRHAIAPAIRECEGLGFIAITEHGRAGNAEFRSPNKFRLTYRPTERAEPPDDWRRVKTVEDARNLAYEARNVGSAVASEPLRETMIDTIVKLQRCSRTEAAIILESLPAAQPPSIE